MFRSDVDPNVPDRLHGYVAGGPIRVILFDGATLYVFNTTIYGMPRDIILVRVRSAEDKYALNLPPGAEPRDMIVRGERLLLLTATPLENGEGFVNAVFATKDVDSLPVVWTELLRFTSPILARSFEHLDGKFYFGLGFDWNPNVIPPGSTFDEPFAGVILSVAFEGL